MSNDGNMSNDGKWLSDERLLNLLEKVAIAAINLGYNFEKSHPPKNGWQPQVRINVTNDMAKRLVEKTLKELQE